MRIGVELFDIAEGQTGGVVPLLQGVFECLFAGWPGCEVTLFGTSANAGLFPSLPQNVRQLSLPREGFYPLLDVYAGNLGLDVLFRSFPGDDELRFPMSRQIVLIPDLQHEFCPQFFSEAALTDRRRTFGRTLQEAGAIATISAHARETILKHPQTKCQDVFLMSPALRTERERPSTDDLSDAERSQLPQGDYFIYPANLWPHKNHRRVFQAFDLFLKQTGLSVELILTGHPEGWTELSSQFAGLPVRHLGFVGRSFLQVLMARSRALLFFSLFEGFGMPLLEAFAAGTPVACSEVTSLPEVGGDAVLTCDPADVPAICELMVRVHGNHSLREQLVARGRQRLTGYSWKVSAAALVAACERLCAREPAPQRADSLPLQRLGQFVEGIQTDRAERLQLIQHLDARLRESEADRDFCHREIKRLKEEMLGELVRAVPRVLHRKLARLFRAG
jgi:glycosyltransferase involved in cell wall biosynthesis